MANVYNDIAAHDRVESAALAWLLETYPLSYARAPDWYWPVIVGRAMASVLTWNISEKMLMDDTLAALCRGPLITGEWIVHRSNGDGTSQTWKDRLSN